MKRKPHYRWFESHGAWLLQNLSLRYSDCPLWLFPKDDRGRDW